MLDSLPAHLLHYGWNATFDAHVSPADHSNLARVVQEHKEAYLVHSSRGNVWAEISGKMRHQGAVRSDFPAVGDWVLLRGLQHLKASAAAPAAPPEGLAQIARILPRRTMLARRVDAGHEQVLAVNVDISFLGASLNENFNVRRLERYLMLAREAATQPVVLLTKADLCDDPARFVEEVRVVAPDARVHAISAVTGKGLEALRALLAPGVTAVILGSSGIGKSTLVNQLAEADVQDMMETREFDDKGRHCTTFRHLVRTASGGLIIDTPGLRGLTLGEANDALGATFADIEALAAVCKFTDCRHETEPGCAIKAALEDKALDPLRMENYLRLQREITAMGRRENRVGHRKQKKLEKRATAQENQKFKQGWNERRGR